MEDFNFESPKTKDFTGILASLAVNDKKSLVILGAYNENVYLSSRNIKNTKVATAEELSTYDLVNADQLILVESSVDLIQKRLN